MKKDKLGDLSMQLSVDIIKLVKDLRLKHETIISNQIGRSATSICANIAEGKYAHGRADFIAKLEISLKKCNEKSRPWGTLHKEGCPNYMGFGIKIRCSLNSRTGRDFSLPPFPLCKLNHSG